MTNPIARARRTWLLGVAVAAVTALLPATAQEPGMRAGGPAAAVPPVVSPAVAGGEVTFRLKAPDARSVAVSGDFGPDAALSRGSDGVWSATVARCPG